MSPAGEMAYSTEAISFVFRGTICHTTKVVINQNGGLSSLQGGFSG
jgi:hypothetical protein